jgi:hypothetical protein
MTLSDWAAIGTGLGTFLLAVATFRLAQLTSRSVQENRELIRAARDEAEAVKDQANAVVEQARQAARQADASIKLVEETVIDRELAWKPWLTARDVTMPNLSPPTNRPSSKNVSIVAGRRPDVSCSLMSLSV